MQPGVFRAALLGLALLLASCSSLQVSAPPASVEQAARLAARGDHAAAATMYAELSAANPPPLGLQLALAGAREWLAAGKPDAALRSLPPPGSGNSAERPSTERSFCPSLTACCSSGADRAHH